MSGGPGTDRGTDRGKAPRRGGLIGFAAASLILHAALLALLQWAGENGTAPPPPPEPVRMVELTPPPAPENPPEPAPEPPPEPEPTPEPEPEREPEPEPPPDPDPQPTPEQQPAPEPAPPAPEPDAPEEERDEAGGGSLILPGVRFRAAPEGDLARFGHAADCADLAKRYSAECADVGPVYLTGDPQPVLGAFPTMAPGVRGVFQAENANRQARAARIARNADGPLPNPNACGEFFCIPETGYGRMRDGQAGQRVMEELGLKD